MKKLMPKGNGFTLIEIVIAAAAIIAIAAAVYYAIWGRNQPNYQASPGYSPSAESCTIYEKGSTSDDDATARATAFVTAYQAKMAASLSIIQGCVSDGTVFDGTQYDLTTDQAVVKDSEFSYGDGSEPGPTTKTSCKLNVSSPKTAIIRCGKESFNLYGVGDPSAGAP